MKKTAFTLAELLIVMGIVGFLAIIILSQTKTIIPNQNLAMFKKAYSVTGQIVSSLVNDEDLYPEIPTNEDNDEFTVGLDNTEAARYRTDERSDDSKFCYLFAEMLNLTSDIKDKCETQTFETSPKGQFESSDGIAWILPITYFTDTDKQYEILIDINGENKPNCLATDEACNCEDSEKNTDGSRICSKPEPDRMKILVKADGKIDVPSDSVEEFYLKAENSSLKYHDKEKKK